jgi:hypothetical protein
MLALRQANDSFVRGNGSFRIDLEYPENPSVLGQRKRRRRTHPVKKLCWQRTDVEQQFGIDRNRALANCLACQPVIGRDDSICYALRITTVRIFYPPSARRFVGNEKSACTEWQYFGDPARNQPEHISGFQRAPEEFVRIVKGRKLDTEIIRHFRCVTLACRFRCIAYTL